MASSSVAALLAGGGAASAFAADFTINNSPGNVVITGAPTAVITNPSITVGGSVINVGTIGPTIAHAAVTIDNNAMFVGGLTNSGTIANPFGTGIAVTDATIGGGIANSGTLSVGDKGIVLDGVSTFSGGITNSGTLSAGESAIEVSTVSTFSGGITNSGTLSASNNGILVSAVSIFSGGITNAGTISAGETAIQVNGITNFSDGISNAGTISAVDDGIFVSGVATFEGGITNAGTISAGVFGIEIFGGVTFGGGITNAGTIWGGQTGIRVDGISNFSGGITNAGTIAGGSKGIFISSASFGGGVSNDGTISGGVWGILVSSVTTLAGGITNSGTIAGGQTGIQIGNVATFSGGIGNSGTITGDSKGIFIAAGSVGGGISNSGLISATGGPGIEAYSAATFSDGITNSGTIIGKTGIVVDSGVATFQGAIVNSGTITGTGGTAIDISAAPNGMTVDILGGAISGNIVGNGTANGDAVNFALGSGTFTYAAPYGFRAIDYVNINSGTVVLNGLNEANYVNAIGGTLAGTGTINANFLDIGAGGMLEPGIPGSAGGTLTVSANFLDFLSGSTYDVTLSPTQHSLTALTGNATIIGGTVALTPIMLGARYSASTFPILTTTSTVTGTFNPTVTYSGTLKLSTTPTLSYVGDDVDLTYGNSIAILNTPSGANQNQQNVISGINNAILGGDTVPTGFQQLGNLGSAGYLNALTQLDGEDATGAATSTFTLMDEFLDLLLGESGGGGPGAAGGGLGFAPDQQADALPPELALAYDSIVKAPPPQTFDQRWSTWASGFGGSSFLEGNAAVGSNNVNATTYGSAAGMEYRPDPNTRLGFALAGSGLNWGLAQNLGTGRSDAFQAGVYAKSYFGPAYVSGALAFGNNWFTTNRTALGDQLTASFSGQSYAARAEGGYRFALPMQYAVIGVTPYAALQTQWFHTPTYSETDLTGGGLGLTYNSTTANDTRSELGTRFDDLTAWNNKPLLLRASLAWAHDWESGTALNATFESLPGSAFTVNGAPLPPDSALTTASAQYLFTANWSFTAKFAGEFAPTAQTYAGSGTLKYTW